LFERLVTRRMALTQRINDAPDSHIQEIEMDMEG